MAGVAQELLALFAWETLLQSPMEKGQSWSLPLLTDWPGNPELLTISEPEFLHLQGGLGNGAYFWYPCRLGGVAVEVLSWD